MIASIWIICYFIHYIVSIRNVFFFWQKVTDKNSPYAECRLLEFYNQNSNQTVTMTPALHHEGHKVIKRDLTQKSHIQAQSDLGGIWNMFPSFKT